MKKNRRTVLFVALTSLVLLAGLDATAVVVTVPDTTLRTGTSFLLPIRVDQLSDRGIIAYQFRLEFDADVLRMVGVEREGCLGNQWGEPTANMSIPGTIIVVQYGIAPLSGSGDLIKLECDVIGNPRDTTQLSFDSFVFNDGEPQAEMTDPVAIFTVTSTGVPILAVSPDTIDFGALDTLRSFSVANEGVGDLNWNVLEDPDIPWIVTVDPLSGASDDTVTVTVSREGMSFGFYSGLLTVQSDGGRRGVVVKMTVPQEFFIVSVTVPDTSQYTSRWVELPIMLDDVTDMEIIAYQFALRYDADVVNIVGATTHNSLSAGWGDAEVNTDTTGQIGVAHYGATPLSGEGTLISLICYAVGNPGDATALSFDRFLFNDGYPHAEWTTPAATFSVDTADVPLIFLSPSVLDFGTTQTVNAFNIRNVGTDTLKWAVSEDPEVEWITSVSPRSGVGEGTVTVAVSRIGLAPGLYSGKVSVTSNGGDGSITVALSAPDGGRRVRLSLPDTSGAVASELIIPVRVNDVSTFGIVEFELTLLYDDGVLEVLEALSGMTLSAVWGPPTWDRPAPGHVRVVHQGQPPLTGSGTIVGFRIRAIGDPENTSELRFSNVLMNGDAGVSQYNTPAGLFTVERPDYPVLSATPLSLDFGSEATTRNFSIRNVGSGTLRWSIFESPEKNWIVSIFPTDGQNQRTVTVIIDRAYLYPDVYTGTLHIASNGGNQNISVRMEVVASDTLPPYLAFSSPQHHAVGMARNMPVFVIIDDEDSSVLPSSVGVTVDSDTIVSEGEDRTAGAVRFVPRNRGISLVYTPLTLFDENSEVVISLTAEDTALPSRVYEGSFSFTTGSATVEVIAEALLASEGGTVDDPDGVFVTLPPGVLADSLTVLVGTVTAPPQLPDSLLSVGRTSFFGPEGLTFCPLPGVGRLVYTDEDLAEAGIVDALGLMVFSFNSESGGWEERQILSNDTNSGTILFQICRLGYVTLAIAQTTSVQDERRDERIPLTYRFMSCQPNPFNPTTSLPFHIPDVRFPVEVTLRIYNVLGEEIRTLIRQRLPGGRYTAIWDGCDGKGRDVPSGVYFCRMSVQDEQGFEVFVQTQKMLFLK